MDTKSTEIRPDQAELTHCTFCSVGFTSLRDGKMRGGWPVIVAVAAGRGEVGPGGHHLFRNRLLRPI